MTIQTAQEFSANIRLKYSLLSTEKTDTTYFHLLQIRKFFHVLWIVGNVSATLSIRHVSQLIMVMLSVSLTSWNSLLLECMKNRGLLHVKLIVQQMTALLILWNTFAQILTICSSCQANSISIKNFQAVKKKHSQSAKKTISVLSVQLKQKQR